MLRRINISVAFIVLICFFLPWEQVSCGGATDSLSGVDLARHDHVLLWLVPLAMLAVLVFGLIRKGAAKRSVFGIVGVVMGGVAAYLMNDERLRVGDESHVISAQLTGWFWLAFISSLAMIVTSIALLLKKQPPG